MRSRVRLLFPLLISCVPMVAMAMPPSPPEGKTWEKIEVLSDEFDGGALDPAKWQPKPTQRYWVGPAPGRFASENVAIADGNLILRTSADPLLHSDLTDKSKRWLLTSCVSSVQALALFGYYEVRMKASKLPTLSSFWLQSSSTEIDIQEGIGQPEVGKLGQSMNFDTHFFSTGQPGADDHPTPQRHVYMPNPITDWHTYGVWWKDSETLVFFLDGKQVGVEKPNGAFNVPMHIYFDTEQHGGRLPSSTELQAKDDASMYVDWVHSYRLVDK